MIKLLIGGSPCTYWSVAQKKNREVEAKGLGWELFKNYLIAKEKFKPDFFLYENNKSAAQAIKDQISRELGVELMHINSALVSAQNRQRFYAFNWSVEQPEDRGILLRDVLESSALYILNATTDGKAQCVRASCYKDGIRNLVGNTVDRRTCVAEPVGVGYRNRREDDGKLYRRFETSGEPKANAITTVQTDSMVAEPICVNSKSGRGGVPGLQPSLSDRIYSIDGKMTAVTASYMPKIAEPIEEMLEGKPIYEVTNGEIELREKKYPIKLPDGFYVIRKLTPVECERLQTLPDGYTAAVSNTQRYKGLGNGWTAEVIIHILNGALKDVPRDEEIVVLSMYDGIGTGRYCLEKMGFTNVTYYAYEIDEPAMKVALSNYPDIIEMGDAFALRDDSWELGKRIQPEQPTEATTESDEPADETTDLSDAPEEIKREITKNAEKLEARETQKLTEPKGAHEKARPATRIDATAQLKKLAEERRTLASIHPDTDRFTNDVLAIEYAVSILEAMAI